MSIRSQSKNSSTSSLGVKIRVLFLDMVSVDMGLISTTRQLDSSASSMIFKASKKKKLVLLEGSCRTIFTLYMHIRGVYSFGTW